VRWRIPSRAEEEANKKRAREHEENDRVQRQRAIFGPSTDERRSKQCAHDAGDREQNSKKLQWSPPNAG